MIFLKKKKHIVFLKFAQQHKTKDLIEDTIHALENFKYTLSIKSKRSHVVSITTKMFKEFERKKKKRFVKITRAQLRQEANIMK